MSENRHPYGTDLGPIGSVPRSKLSCALLVAALSLLAPRAARAEGAWMLEMNAAYGPRIESFRRAPASFARWRNDVTDAFSIGVRFGRLFPQGVTLFAEVRAPVPALEGEIAAGAGLGYARRVSRAGVFFGALIGGYKQLSHDFCECGRIEYAGPWVRAELGGRYLLFADLGRGLALRRPTPSFDLYLSASLGIDLVFARYPDGSQYGHDRRDTGLRWGIDPMLGAGFLW
jgi:hypothetical protein